MTEFKKPIVGDRPAFDSEAEPFIDIQGVGKKFGVFTAIDDISLKIYKGELFSLLGGSGCGKTTLLRILAGFEKPSKGRVIIDGIDVTDMPPYERPVNMMFQSYALFPHMTVEKNVAYGLRRDGVSKAETRERVADMLALVEMSDFAKRKPNQLSGGQKQRVALARSLVKRPKVLLLDEPLGALDKRLREHTQFELMNIQDKLGITFIVVTHDQEEAMTLSSRIAVMDKGNVIQVGTPSDIYESPETKFTAEFIGSINMFDCQVKESGRDHLVAHCGSLGQDFHLDWGVAVKEARQLWLAVRPEKIQITRQAKAGQGINELPAFIHDIAYMGTHTIYRIRLANGQILQATTPNLRRSSEGERNLTWEDAVFVSWDPSSMVVLMK
ncbi:ABC transporter ATP-binding protein [Kiloniella laminariae]|uniref:ABC transporter ATP-binding protein n=1 Tax=Kiloniella laminariae TaxID=454162 RepID=UPI0003634F24|nr:ABC transporter ATP-binding protein [Kiloniella laminariae]